MSAPKYDSGFDHLRQCRTDDGEELPRCMYLITDIMMFLPHMMLIFSITCRWHYCYRRGRQSCTNHHTAVKTYCSSVTLSEAGSYFTNSSSLMQTSDPGHIQLLLLNARGIVWGCHPFVYSNAILSNTNIPELDGPWLRSASEAGSRCRPNIKGIGRGIWTTSLVQTYY